MPKGVAVSTTPRVYCNAPRSMTQETAQITQIPVTQLQTAPTVLRAGDGETWSWRDEATRDIKLNCSSSRTVRHLEPQQANLQPGHGDICDKLTDTKSRSKR
ncbi:hypothetical protein C8J57DRAFT_1224969 [Mycena rebaudengoi]|nr:hypothetical protein C8J57DRAFT_1224969 [Mycena rebaudengoi]